MHFPTLAFTTFSLGYYQNSLAFSASSTLTSFQKSPFLGTSQSSALCKPLNQRSWRTLKMQDDDLSDEMKDFVRRLEITFFNSPDQEEIFPAPFKFESLQEEYVPKKKCFQEVLQSIDLVLQEKGEFPPRILLFEQHFPSCPLKRRFPKAQVDYLEQAKLPSYGHTFRLGDRYALRLRDLAQEENKRYDSIILKDLSSIIPDSDPRWVFLMIAHALLPHGQLVVIEDSQERGGITSHFLEILMLQGFEAEGEKVDGGNRIFYFGLPK